MKSWRITKYNPSKRNIRGEYQVDEWVSIYDIGEEFDGKLFTFDEYIEVENEYVETILHIVNLLKIPFLKVTELEINSDIIEHDYSTNKLDEAFKNIKNNDIVELNNIELIIRLVLRGDLWCKLIYKNIVEFHFGYDYYMYVLSSIDLDSIFQKSKLYIECFESPYR